jgi:hypothetical protein
MLDQTIIYFMFLVFITILNIIGYIKIPILSLIMLIATLLIVVSSFDAFQGYEMVAFIFILTNGVLAFMGLARARADT